MTDCVRADDGVLFCNKERNDGEKAHLAEAHRQLVFWQRDFRELEAEVRRLNTVIADERNDIEKIEAALVFADWAWKTETDKLEKAEASLAAARREIDEYRLSLNVALDTLDRAGGSWRELAMSRIESKRAAWRESRDPYSPRSATLFPEPVKPATPCKTCGGTGVVVSGSESRPKSVLPRPCPSCSAAKPAARLDTPRPSGWPKVPRRSVEREEGGT